MNLAPTVPLLVGCPEEKNMTATYTPPLPYPVTSPLTSGPYTQVVAPVPSVAAVQVPTEYLTAPGAVVPEGAPVPSVAAVQVPTEYLTAPGAVVPEGAPAASVEQGPIAINPTGVVWHY